MSPPPGVRLECLSEATLPGAHAVKLAFLGAGKAFCLVCPYSWEPESLESFAHFYRLHPETMRGTAVAVREDTGEVVGVIATATHGQPRSPEDAQMHATKPGECYVEWLAVTAAARGCGVGTKLLRWARRHAEAHNCSELTLGVVNGNPAIRLYEREGFESVPVDACEAACTCLCITLTLGCPNGRFGGFNMRMRLEGDENERDAKTMSFRGYAKTMSFRTMSMSRGS
jgi:ribosomal protein S18 acetylase RimI-like enzyme